MTERTTILRASATKYAADRRPSAETELKNTAKPATTERTTTHTDHATATVWDTMQTVIAATAKSRKKLLRSVRIMWLSTQPPINFAMKTSRKTAAK